MNIKLTIPERLKDLRTERNLILEQLSEATGISRAALGKYEADDFKDLPRIHISEPTRQAESSYAVFCLKKKKRHLYGLPHYPGNYRTNE